MFQIFVTLTIVLCFEKWRKYILYSYKLYIASIPVTALMWASGSEAKDEKDHTKGLMEAATKGHEAVVTILLQFGALPDKRDKDGITASKLLSCSIHRRRYSSFC